MFEELIDYEELEEPIDLGECCACGSTEEKVRNIVALEYRSPTPGSGWGCFVCQIPSDGAIAVVCDKCLEKFQSGEDVLKSAVFGYPLSKERCDIKALTESFRHLDIPH